ncbi:MAG: extracellular solute-binding protein [Patescibacteria group bacterium]
MKPFHIAVLVFFGALAMFAVFIFASFSSQNRDAVGEVVIWGTLPENTVDEVLSALFLVSDGYEEVSYRQLAESTFVATLVEAIAADRGPDLILLPHDAVLSERDKVITIPYRSISRRSFQDTFVEAGEAFLTDEGMLGLPFYIDPFVLYWNRTLFSNAGIARVPRFWDEFVDIAPVLSKHTQGGTLTQSAVSLGEWGNITHAKEVFTSLIIGLGNPITQFADDGELRVVLNGDQNAAVSPAESALRFYTDFADPVKTTYSWNRSLSPSRDAFTAGFLATYFGKASELLPIRAQNPNLNFDVAAYPRVRDGVLAVPADVYALAIPRGSKNQSGALKVAVAFSGIDVQKSLMAQTGLPSVRRDVLSASPENPFESIFRDAALNAYVWFDPDPEGTEKIFERMVEETSSGKLRIPEAVSQAQEELSTLAR